MKRPSSSVLAVRPGLVRPQRACQASKLDIYGTGTTVKVCTYKKKQCKALPKAGLLPSACDPSSV